MGLSKPLWVIRVESQLEAHLYGRLRRTNTSGGAHGGMHGEGREHLVGRAKPTRCALQSAIRSALQSATRCALQSAIRSASRVLGHWVLGGYSAGGTPTR